MLSEKITTDWIDGARQGNPRAIARLITRVESDAAAAQAIVRAIYAHTGQAHIVGITGSPGSGKSSLVNELAKSFRRGGRRVGIVAVDPTSPFTGGAILGDRIRMAALSGDKGVFIRSMATRGSLGGLARAARDAVRAMDAAGFDVILIETVGAGQSEVDIVRTAHTTLVIEAPGLGDDVQAIKAGILEIADVLVINKADRPGAVNTMRALRAMLELGHPTAPTQSVNHHGETMRVSTPADPQPAQMWIPPILQTVSTKEAHDPESGIASLVEAIESHRAYLQSAGNRAALARDRIHFELMERLRHELMARLLRDVPPDVFDAVIEQVAARQLDPQSAVEMIIDTQRTPKG